MAQSYLESMLSEHERILYTARQHWFILVSSIFLEVMSILILLAIIVTVAVLQPQYAMLSVAIGFVIILIPVVTMTRDILHWSNHQYIITNRRVVQLSGVIDKTVTDSSLEKVNDIKMVQTFFGRMFDFGDIEILTASELGVNKFTRIENPVEFKTAMLNAKEKLESGENYTHGDIAVSREEANLPALLSQLDELRKNGILTEAEFQNKKAQLLTRL